MSEPSRDEQITSLSRAVNDIDASRRVGWAQSYAAKEQLDQALRDLNLSRADADRSRNAASYLYGYMQEMLARIPEMGDTDLPAHLRSALDGMGLTSVDGPTKAGAKDAVLMLSRWDRVSEQRLAMVEARAQEHALKRDAGRSHSRMDRDLMEALARSVPCNSRGNPDDPEGPPRCPERPRGWRA